MELGFCRVGPIMTNCYMLHDDKRCLVVDPGDEPDVVLEMIGGHEVEGIIVTHCHMDHIGGLPQVAKATGAPIYAFAGEVEAILNPGPPEEVAAMNYVPVADIDVKLADGEEFELVGTRFKTIHTPGHTPGSACFYNESNAILFAGDTLFWQTHGRTDFPGGSQVDMVKSLKRLMELPDDVTVLPGHDRPTSIGDERRWIERLGAPGAVSTFI